MRRSLAILWATSFAATSGFLVQASGAPTAETEAAEAARAWLLLQSARDAATLCSRMTDDFTSVSQWDGRAGTPDDRRTFCKNLAGLKYKSLLIFNASGFDVKFAQGTPASGEATVSFTQYFCGERPGFSYSSIGREQLRLRRGASGWQFAAEEFVGNRRLVKQGCLPRPVPQRPECSTGAWCPTDPVLFFRLLRQVCMGQRVSVDEYQLLAKEDLLFLFNSLSALHGYRFDEERWNGFFYGPAQRALHPAECRFAQDPTYDRTVKKSRLTREQFRLQVEMRDFYKNLR